MVATSSVQHVWLEGRQLHFASFFAARSSDVTKFSPALGLRHFTHKHSDMCLILPLRPSSVLGRFFRGSPRVFLKPQKSWNESLLKDL